MILPSVEPLKFTSSKTILIVISCCFGGCAGSLPPLSLFQNFHESRSVVAESVRDVSRCVCVAAVVVVPWRFIPPYPPPCFLFHLELAFVREVNLCVFNKEPSLPFPLPFFFQSVLMFSEDENPLKDDGLIGSRQQTKVSFEIFWDGLSGPISLVSGLKSYPTFTPVNHISLKFSFPFSFPLCVFLLFTLHWIISSLEPFSLPQYVSTGGLLAFRHSN